MFPERDEPVLSRMRQQKKSYDEQRRRDPDFHKPKSAFMHFYQAKLSTYTRFKPQLKPNQITALLWDLFKNEQRKKQFEEQPDQRKLRDQQMRANNIFFGSHDLQANSLNRPGEVGGLVKGVEAGREQLQMSHE